jgi:uncharacterized peroxidase-related enzyme
MEPMFLKDVEEKKPEGEAGEMIERMKAAGVPVPQIWHLFAFKPDITQHLADFTQGVMRGPSPLSPGIRELIAAFTSRRNDCPFWIGSHAAGAAELLEDSELVLSILEDFRSSRLSDKEKALFEFIEKVNHTSNQIKQEDVDSAKRAGWTDEAIYDAINVCALFNFYNRWIDATGVHDMPASAYEMSGKRLKEVGYVRDWRK